MYCLLCNTEFVREWPNTKQKYCGKKCMQAAYRVKHKDILEVRNKAYYETHRKRVLQTKRKYNISAKGKLTVNRWYLKNRDNIIAKHLHALKTDPVAKAIHQSRQAANRTLKRLRLRICEVCSAIHNKPLRIECHHMDENPLNNELNNLKWLCSSCHGDIHSEISSIKQSFIFRNNSYVGSPLVKESCSVISCPA